MNRRFRCAPFLLALLLAATAAAGAQDGAAGPAWSRDEETQAVPFAALLRHREELRLSRRQVERLQAVGRELEERNRPLRQQLRRQREAYVAQRRAQVRRLSAEQRRDTLRRLREERARGELPPEMRPVVERMRSNTRRAMAEAQSVLTHEQKRRARALVRERRREARPRGDG